MATRSREANGHSLVSVAVAIIVTMSFKEESEAEEVRQRRQSQLAEDRVAEAAGGNGHSSGHGECGWVQLLLFQVPLVRPISRLCAAMEATGDKELLLEESGAAFGNLSLCMGLVLLRANNADVCTVWARTIVSL
jgi:hypothetical protein